MASRTTTPGLLNPFQPVSQDLFQKFIKIYLDKQGSSESKKEVYSRFFIAKKPDLYYRNCQMECYSFCRQCEDYFDILGATD